ncbi:hypothetical protein LCGC14_1844770 [marine sediment metagenome]|uniref:Uncharacterized protein n=1 Tax=marine sediment metagenome TaxID=412755 RepID=A0A0F9IRQ6_9ZZZZ
MEASYEDITSRIKDKPKWWDANGVPRFDKFTPDQCPDIYAKEVVLLKIACQSCNKRFRVELHGGVFSRIKHPHKLHYGDPPRHMIDGIGCVGETMNSDALAVLEVWHKDSMLEWERLPELEGLIDEEDAEEMPGIPTEPPIVLPNESKTEIYVGKIHKYTIYLTPGAMIHIESFHKMPNALRRLATWLILGWTYEERK